MEKSEPSLVPQWLKGSGNTSSSSSSQFQLSSSLLSDNHSTARRERNKPSVISDHGVGRASVSDRTSSAYFRRSSSSNGTTHSRSYNSFNRGRRDRDWEKDTNGYHDEERYHDYDDSFSNMLPSFDKNPFRRSQSLISGRQDETWPRKLRSDLNVANKHNHSSGNDRNGVGITANKYTLECNFPALGAEERKFGAELGRVSSPGLSTAIQNLPAGNPAVTGGDSWKSALAEVPVNVGSSGTAQTVSATVASIVPSKASSGLNMAETVAQGPIRARAHPQLNVESQKLEELAIKQSRQLIPLTPSTPKTSVPSLSEKSRSKIGQHHSSLSLSNSRSGSVRSDGLKTSNESRLQILKPSREMNGFASASKDSMSPTYGSKTVNSPVSSSPSSTASAPFRNSSHSSSTGNAKLNPTSSHLTIEKRTVAQARSRHDFFNLIKKNASQNNNSAVPYPGPEVSPSSSVRSGEVPIKDGTTSIPLDNGNASSAVSDPCLAVSPSSSGLSDEVSSKDGATSIPMHNDNAPFVVSDPGPAVSPSFSEISDEVPSKDDTTSVRLDNGSAPSAVSDPAVSPSSSDISDEVPGKDDTTAIPPHNDNAQSAVSNPGPAVTPPSSEISDEVPSEDGATYISLHIDNAPSAVSDPDPAVSPSSSERLDEVPINDGTSSTPLDNDNAPLSQTSISGLPIQDNSTEMTHNSESSGDSHQCSSNGEKHTTCRVFLGAEEEEAAFLRKLGWDENASEEDGLTEEEIREFYEEYMKLRPSAKHVPRNIRE